MHGIFYYFSSLKAKNKKKIKDDYDYDAEEENESINKGAISVSWRKQIIRSSC